MTVAWVFPGQGSQKIGMAKQIENLPNTKKRFNYGSELFERNLFQICELETESKNYLKKQIIVLKKLIGLYCTKLTKEYWIL